MSDVTDAVPAQALKTQPEDLAREAIQKVIQKYAMEAVWPSQDKSQTKSLIIRMAADLAALFGRTVEDISLADIARTQAKIESICGAIGIHHVRYGTIRSTFKTYESAQMVIDFVSHLYWVGNLFYGNFGPIIRKFGLKVSGAPLARAAGVWLAGQALSELYYDPKRFKPRDPSATREYHPLFDSLSRDQYRDLALLMGIDGRISWDELRLRKEILSDLSSSYHNKVSALWAEVPSYHNILLMLCSDLAIPAFSPMDTEEELEEKIVRKVLAESVQKLSPTDLKSFESAIRANMTDGHLKNALKSSLLAGGLIAGRLSGFGLYVGASSALAAIGQGVGIAAAIGSSTALSSALGAVFGPLGISLAAGAAALQWTKARPRKALPFVLFIAASRGMLAAESSSSIPWYARLFIALKRVRVRLGLK